MKLNLNFNGFTKLRDWWNTVRSNFEIIETECNKTRTIADNACTKEEARSYINEFIGLSDEYMAVIEAFTELYKENESTVAAMDEVYGGRLKYYSKEAVFDVNEAVGEDAIFFCKAETENTPASQTGVLISKTDNKQMWISEDGDTYCRELIGDAWSEWGSHLNEFEQNIMSQMSEKSVLVTGTYTGDGTESRIIDLGYTPKAILIKNCIDTYSCTSGAATKNVKSNLLLFSDMIDYKSCIVENGMQVSAITKKINNNEYITGVNTPNSVYNYIAFI